MSISEYDLCFYLSRWMAHFVLGIGLDMVRCGSVSLAPGTKVRVQDCPVRNGKLLLSSANCSVLGGKVYELFTSWKANKVRSGNTVDVRAGTGKVNYCVAFE